MPTKKLVVSIYLQYSLVAVGALLLYTFVRQLGGVLLTFLLAGILAHALAVAIVAITSAAKRYLVETLVFEGPAVVRGEARSTVSAGEAGAARPVVRDGH